MRKKETTSYNGFTGAKAKLAKRADRYCDRVVSTRGSEKGFGHLAFWGFIAGWEAAKRSKRRRR